MVAVLTVEIFTYTGHVPPLQLRFTVLESHLLWTGMHPPLTMNLLWNIQDVIISRAKLSLHWQNLHCQVTFEWHSGCGSEQGTLPISSSKHRTETTLTINSYASLHKLWTYCGAFKTCDFLWDYVTCIGQTYTFGWLWETFWVWFETINWKYFFRTGKKKITWISLDQLLWSCLMEDKNFWGGTVWGQLGVQMKECNGGNSSHSCELKDCKLSYFAQTLLLVCSNSSNDIEKANLSQNFTTYLCVLTPYAQIVLSRMYVVHTLLRKALAHIKD